MDAKKNIFPVFMPLKVKQNEKPYLPINLDLKADGDLSEDQQRMMRDWHKIIQDQKRVDEDHFAYFDLKHQDGRIEHIRAWPIDYDIGGTNEDGSISVTMTMKYDSLTPKPWYERLWVTLRFYIAYIRQSWF